MLRLLCKENNLEYTGNGYLQCGRHVDCPKKLNNKVLGFDCFAYIDNLPEGCKTNIIEEHTKDEITVKTDTTDANLERIDGHKTERIEMSRTIEYVVA